MLRSIYAYDQLKQMITSGEYPPGSKLPSEQQLAEKLQISRVTLRTALEKLRRENLIEKIGRSGNYVSTLHDRKRFLFPTFSPNLEDLGIVNSYTVNELQNVLEKYNHSLILYSALNIREHTAKSFSKLLKDNNISGIFLRNIDFNFHPALLDIFYDCGVPVINFGNQLSLDGSFASVCADIRQAFGDGVRYLAALGYKRIATIFKKDSMRGFTRNSYEDFLNSIGLTESIPLIFDTSVIKENKLPDLVNSPERPEAFMCFCDCTAMKVINILHQCKINIPNDVAVMGISGYLERLFITPPLSIVNFHYDRIAQQAVKLMLESSRWFKKEPAVISYISHEIVARGTTPALINK